MKVTRNADLKKDQNVSQNNTMIPETTDAPRPTSSVRKSFIDEISQRPFKNKYMLENHISIVKHLKNNPQQDQQLAKIMKESKNQERIKTYMSVAGPISLPKNQR